MKTNGESLLVHRQARFKFTLIEEFVAGMVLSGGEVKMLRLHRGSLIGSYVRILNGEAYLLNAQIPLYPFARQEDYEPTQPRKLLLHKRELLRLQQSQETKGLALVPLEIFLLGNHIKLRLAIAKGKQLHDRREELKKRDLEREGR